MRGHGLRGSVAVILLTLASLLMTPTASATLGGVLVPSSTGAIGDSPPLPVPNDVPWSQNVLVSETDTSGNQNEISMAIASDGRIHMGWNDARVPNPDYRCGYSYSTDGGLSWAANRLLHLPPWEADGDPVVIVDSNDDVYFICMAFNRSAGGSRITVHKSTDGGANFAPPVIASDTTNGFNDKPWAIAVGTTIHLCYANFAGNSELRVTRSLDGGQSWDPTQILDFGGNGCVFAWDGAGRLHLAWVRGGAVYSFTSTNAGVTWGPARFVGSAPWTNDPNQRAGPLPQIAADPATAAVYLTWPANDGGGSWDVRFSRSSDFGNTWSVPVIVNDNSIGRQFMPAVAVDGTGTVHVIWYDDSSGNMAVRHATSSNGGITWTPSGRVTDTEWTSAFFIGDYIALVADPAGFVNAGWCDRRTGENEAFFARTGSVGPPQLERIEVSPPEAWGTADDFLMFTALGFDQYGLAYPITPAWAATGGSISLGLYSPQVAGDWQVWANESGVSGSAVVHIAPGALAAIEVTPADATITADDVQQYDARGFDAKGNEVTISPTWGASDGSITNGMFTPRRVGVWTIYANESGIVGSTPVTVAPGALAEIIVTPPTATITADDTQPFIATGRDANDNEVPITPIWTTNGGAIDGAGLYSPSQVGTWTVFATALGHVGTAEVTVVPGALFRIDVQPADVTTSADLTIQYFARGYDVKDNEVALSPSWSATAGVIDAGGLYTPGPVGVYQVTATDGVVSGSTSVTVFVGPLARIEVLPPTATITTDDTLQYTALGYDIRDNAVSFAPTWATTCGGIDPFGLYSPGPVRACVVYANASGLSGSATVTVTPGRLVRIDVTPPVATITADDPLQFTARGYDSKDNEVAISPTWTASNGTVDGSGLYDPWRVGIWTVKAAQGTVEGQAAVTVTPGRLARLEVSPPDVTVRADTSAQFSAEGFDRRGNSVALSGTSWSAGNGSVSAGRFEPHRVGTWTIAAQEGGFEDSGIARVIPGAVASVVLTPIEGQTEIGGTIAYEAVAYDAKGNAVPDALLVWRVDGGVGEVDGSGHFVATGAGDGGVTVTAANAWGSASASATVTVQGVGGPVSSGWVPWLAAVLVAAALLAILLLVVARRRRREGPSGPPP